MKSQTWPPRPSQAAARDRALGRFGTYRTDAPFPRSPLAQEEVGTSVTRRMGGLAVVALGAAPQGRVGDALHVLRVQPSSLGMPDERIDEASAALLRFKGPASYSRRHIRILLVNGDPVALQRIEAYLSDEGYWVASVSSFQLAKELLHSVRPDLLMADIRLGAFNGLHLAARSRLDSPSLPVIITHASYDPVLETEAQRLGATFVVNPLENSEFLRHVRGALDKHRQVLPTSRP